MSLHSTRTHDVSFLRPSTCQSWLAHPRHHAPRRSRSIPFAWSLLLVLATLSCRVLAAAEPEAYAAQITAPPSLDDLAGHLLLDKRLPPALRRRLDQQVYWGEDELLLMRPRADDGNGDDTSTDKNADDKTETNTNTSNNQQTESTATHRDNDQTTTDSKTAATKTAATTVPSSLGLATPTRAAATSPLPSPFDDTPSSEFQSQGDSSNSCPDFMSNLLNSDEFKSCYPISMMMQTSQSFFDAEKDLLSIVRVLDATCAASSSTCTEYFDQAAQNLTKSDNCKTEYDNKQDLVIQAYDGLRAYQMMYSATCLQDPSTQMYCFASAVTNVTNPTDYNFYFMPYGYDLPGGSAPSCNWCTQQTMAVFHAASSDRSQLVSSVYADAAQQVDTLCGPSFVNSTLPSASSPASALSMPPLTASAAAGLVVLLLGSLL